MGDFAHASALTATTGRDWHTNSIVYMIINVWLREISRICVILAFIVSTLVTF